MTCNCKGIRFCAECKDSERIQKLKFLEDPTVKYKDYSTFVFNVVDGKCYASPELRIASTVEEIRNRTDEVAKMSSEELAGLESFEIHGLLLIKNFIDEEEENRLVEDIEKVPWLPSQSGRRKQDYGPRVNFKEKKVKCDRFVGVPEYANRLLQMMTEKSGGILKDYQPFELCNLEYLPTRLSGIELHVDDIWIWGNRLISLNLLNEGIMTYENQEENKLVFLYMERRALLSMFDDARYKWKHGIFPHHIPGRRIALTMREPAQSFKPGGEHYERYGKELIERGNVRIKI